MGSDPFVQVGGCRDGAWVGRVVLLWFGGVVLELRETLFLRLHLRFWPAAARLWTQAVTCVDWVEREV